MLAGELNEYVRILEEVVNDYAELVLGNLFAPKTGLWIDLDYGYCRHSDGVDLSEQSGGDRFRRYLFTG